MPDLFRSFETEEQFNEHLQETQQAFITTLGFETLEALQESLNRNPDEELTAQNQQLTEQLSQAKTDSEKALVALKRELSGKLGVNLFEDGSLDSFLGGIKQNQDLLESLNNEKATLLAEKNAVDVENNLLKVGIQPKRIERAKGLVLTDIANGKSVKEAVDALIAEFPEWKGGSGQVGANLNPDNSGLTEREIYLRDNGYTK